MTVANYVCWWILSLLTTVYAVVARMSISYTQLVKMFEHWNNSYCIPDIFLIFSLCDISLNSTLVKLLQFGP